MRKVAPIAIAVILINLSNSNGQEVKFEMVVKESGFEHKTKSGILNVGDKKNIDIVLTEPGGILYSYTYNETSRRNASVEFSKDKYTIKWTGSCETESDGTSGNFEGRVMAIFVKPIIQFNPQQVALVENKIQNINNSTTFRKNDNASFAADVFELNKAYFTTAG
jgi:hypothetical protein